MNRCPAYRRRRAYRPPRKPEPPASYILMRDYLKYVMWVSRVGLVISTLFFIDYFLPYQHAEETVTGITAYRLRRSVSYHIITTNTGRDIKLYDYKATNFKFGEPIAVAVTPIYGSIITVANASGTYREWVAYMYSSLIFFPVLLFVNSLLAFIFRKKIEFCFNLNITALILLIITLTLL